MPQNLVSYRTSYVRGDNYYIYDIFYKNTNGDQFDQTSLSQEGLDQSLIKIWTLTCGYYMPHIICANPW